MRLAQLHRAQARRVASVEVRQVPATNPVQQAGRDEYSEWVVKRAKTLLSSIFIEAVDLGFLAANPMAKVKLPRCKVTAKPVIPREDVMRLYAAIPALRDRLMFPIGVFLGARASELFGLAADC